jgi:hypothetical protein
MISSTFGVRHRLIRLYFTLNHIGYLLRNRKHRHLRVAARQQRHDTRVSNA